MGHLGAILGPSWNQDASGNQNINFPRGFNGFWVHLGATLGHLEAILRPSWGHLGAMLGPLGAILGPSWGFLGHLGAILESRCIGEPKYQFSIGFLMVFGFILEPLWAILRPSWGHLGPSGGHFRAILGPSWGLLGHLGPSWGQDAVQERTLDFPMREKWASCVDVAQKRTNKLTTY